MKDPTKDIIEKGDKVILNGILYQAVKAPITTIPNSICDSFCEYKEKGASNCAKVNCRGIYYKKAKGGV